MVCLLTTKRKIKIEKLIDDGTIVVACGGGGVPVFKNVNTTKVEAVIDKDLASSLLAKKLHADKFIILTAVNQVMINFGKENETALDRISVDEAERYIANDEFKKGFKYKEHAFWLTKYKTSSSSLGLISRTSPILEGIPLKYQM
mgnify:CR=1 FL=1